MKALALGLLLAGMAHAQELTTQVVIDTGVTASNAGFQYKYQWPNPMNQFPGPSQYPIYIVGYQIFMGLDQHCQADFVLNAQKLAGSGVLGTIIAHADWDRYAEPNGIEGTSVQKFFPAGTYITLNQGDSILMAATCNACTSFWSIPFNQITFEERLIISYTTIKP